MKRGYLHALHAKMFFYYCLSHLLIYISIGLSIQPSFSPSIHPQPAYPYSGECQALYSYNTCYIVQTFPWSLSLLFWLLSSGFLSFVSHPTCFPFSPRRQRGPNLIQRDSRLGPKMYKEALKWSRWAENPSWVGLDVAAKLPSPLSSRTFVSEMGTMTIALLSYRAQMAFA